MAKKIGRPPTPQESGLAAAAALLAPDKTLDRLDGFAKYLLGLASLIALIVTGFGAVGPGGLSTSWILLIPIVLFSLSLGLAVSGLTPRLGKTIPSDLNELARYYEAAIRRRHRFVWWAGVLFAAGIFLSPVCIAASRQWSARAGVKTSGQIARGQAGLALTGSVERLRLRAEECLHARGVVLPAGTTVVFDSLARPAADGKATIAVNIPNLDKAYEMVAIRTSVVPCPSGLELSLR